MTLRFNCRLNGFTSDGKRERHYGLTRELYEHIYSEGEQRSVSETN